MKHAFMGVMLLAAITGLTSSAHSEKPTWARKAIAFPTGCWEGERSAFPFRKCKPIRIPSPDGKLSIEVFYEKTADGLTAHARVLTPNRGMRHLVLPLNNGAIDLLWSPDSKAFFMDGGSGGAYWGFWVYVFLIDDPNLEAHNLTSEVQLDMVRSFPPCKAAYLNEKDCKSIETAPDYNVSGIDWLDSSSTIVVMAEVPCSGGYGGIMCQVMGYEIAVPSGKILRRLDAKQLKLGWQKSMAWKFRIPDPPEYEKE